MLRRLLFLAVLVALLPVVAVRVLPLPPPNAPIVRVTADQLLHSPASAFDGKWVVLSGQARDSLATPLGTFFTLWDGTGTIPVAARGGTPRPGSNLEVRAVAYTLFSLGDWLKAGPILVATVPASDTTPSERP